MYFRTLVTSSLGVSWTWWVGAGVDSTRAVSVEEAPSFDKVDDAMVLTDFRDSCEWADAVEPGRLGDLGLMAMPFQAVFLGVLAFFAVSDLLFAMVSTTSAS